MTGGGFVCINCGKNVKRTAWGTKNRNHCPFCLYSLHVDNEIGDRRAKCKGLMKPIGKSCKDDGEEIIWHKCQKCDLVRKNRVAGDDSIKLVEKLEVLG